jgi:hypothetical protein
LIWYLTKQTGSATVLATASVMNIEARRSEIKAKEVNKATEVIEAT